MVPSNLIEATFQQVRPVKLLWLFTFTILQMSLPLTSRLCFFSTKRTWFPSSKSRPEPSCPTSSTWSQMTATLKVGRCTWSWPRLRRSCTRRVPAAASRWTSSASSSSPPPWVSRTTRYWSIRINNDRVLKFRSLNLTGFHWSCLFSSHMCLSLFYPWSFAFWTWSPGPGGSPQTVGVVTMWRVVCRSAAGQDGRARSSSGQRLSVYQRVRHEDHQRRRLVRTTHTNPECSVRYTVYWQYQHTGPLDVWQQEH